MARKSSTAVVDAPEGTEAPEVDSEVSTATEAVEPTEAEVSTDADAETEGEDEDEEIDLSALNAVLSEILAGDISDPEQVDFAPVVTAYNALSRKGKSQATREMRERSQGLLEDGDFDQARTLLLAGKATKAAKPKGETRPRTPADITTPVVEKLVTFQLAYGAVAGNLPDGIAADWQDRVKALFEAAQGEVETYRAWLTADAETRGEAPEVSVPAMQAARLAFKSTRKPYGPRHDVGKHIEQVMAAQESGAFLSEAELGSAKSEEYGDESCSTSAVTARLNSDKPLAEGLSVIERDGKRGVVKA